MLIDDRLRHLQVEYGAEGRYMREMKVARQQERSSELLSVANEGILEQLEGEGLVHERGSEECADHPSLLPQERPSK